ncbi:hypothetical protein ACFL2Z_03825, partial [Candidatus Eisenbacteria bacterium]
GGLVKVTGIEELKSYKVPRRYGSLRFIAGIYSVFAWLLLLACVLAIVAVILGTSLGEIGLPGLTAIFPLVIIGIGGFAALSATAESIMVIIDTEENTRRAADLLDRG